MTRYGLTLLMMTILAGNALVAGEKPERQTPREALQTFNDLIGSWKATGTPEGRREKKQREFWTETLRWAWRFKGDDAWLSLTIDKGKYFTSGQLRYLPDKGLFELKLATPQKESLTFTGPFQKGQLLLERVDDKKNQHQRLVMNLLHEDRFVYRFETKPNGRSIYFPIYQVGATKEGTTFAAGDGKPECVVTGGLGTIAVEYKGQTYYVCCSGCRDAFKEDPEKYIKESQERKAKKK